MNILNHFPVASELRINYQQTNNTCFSFFLFHWCLVRSWCIVTSDRYDCTSIAPDFGQFLLYNISVNTPVHLLSGTDVLYDRRIVKYHEYHVTDRNPLNSFWMYQWILLPINNTAEMVVMLPQCSLRFQFKKKWGTHGIISVFAYGLYKIKTIFFLLRITFLNVIYT